MLSRHGVTFPARELCRLHGRLDEAAYLIDQAGLEKATPDVAASLQQQRADYEMLSKQVHCLNEIDSRLSHDNI